MNRFSIVKLSKSKVKVLLNGIKINLGITVANFLRKTLFSLDGYCIYYLRIKGLRHEYNYIDGIVEDILEIIVNIKKMDFFMYNCSKISINIYKKGPCILSANDFIVKNFFVPFFDNYICEITSNLGINIEIGIKKGTGYFNKSGYFKSKIFINNCFSPVKNVRYNIKKNKMSESIFITFTTKKSVNPISIYYYCIRTLLNQFSFLNEA